MGGRSPAGPRHGGFEKGKESFLAETAPSPGCRRGDGGSAFDARLAVLDVGLAHGDVRVHGDAAQALVGGQQVVQGIEAQVELGSRGQLPGMDEEEDIGSAVAHKADAFTHGAGAQEGPDDVETVPDAPAAQGLSEILTAGIDVHQDLLGAGHIGKAAQAHGGVHAEAPEFHKGFLDAELQQAVDHALGHEDVGIEVFDAAPDGLGDDGLVEVVDRLGDMQEEDVVEGEPEAIPGLQRVGDAGQGLAVVIIQGIPVSQLLMGIGMHGDGPGRHGGAAAVVQARRRVFRGRGGRSGTGGRGAQERQQQERDKDMGTHAVSVWRLFADRLLAHFFGLGLDAGDELVRGAAGQDVLELGAVVFDQAQVLHDDVIDAPAVVLGHHAVGHGHAGAVLHGDLGADFHTGLGGIGDLAGIGHLLAVIAVHLVQVGGQQQVGKGVAEAFFLGGGKFLPAGAHRTGRELAEIEDMVDLVLDLAAQGRPGGGVHVVGVLDAVQYAADGDLQGFTGRRSFGRVGGGGKAGQGQAEGEGGSGQQAEHRATVVHITHLPGRIC